MSRPLEPGPFGPTKRSHLEAPRRWRFDFAADWSGPYGLALEPIWHPWARGFWIHLPLGRLGFLWRYALKGGESRGE